MINPRRLILPLILLLLALPLSAQERTTPAPTPTASLSPTPASPRTATVTPSPTLTPQPVVTDELEDAGEFAPALVITQAPTLTPTATGIPVFPLQAGSVEGNINDSAPRARYSFSGGRDEGVTIRMETTSGNLDPFLSLFAPDGSLLATNDDQAPGDRNAQISLTLPVVGSYIIEASRFEQGETVSSGTFRLTLTRANAPPTGTPGNPLDQPPNFGVSYTAFAYQDVGTGRIEGDTVQYFAFPGTQGDLVRLILARSGGNLLPRLRIYDEQRREIGRDAQTRDSEAIVFATLPQTGWYLVEVGRRGSDGGTGTFDLFINRLANATLQVGELITGTFTADVPVLSYIVNARLGDSISVNMFTVDAAAGIQPSLEILDLSLRTLDRAVGERFVTVQSDVPRSAPYILRVTNLNPDAVGAFNLRLSTIPVNQAALDTKPIAYNEQSEGLITDGEPTDLYRFSGKTGELVTITMTAQTGGGRLDPYLILMDNDLNELIANDDTGASRDARIVQYRLPKDGDYLILASRSSLALGATSGVYQLALTAGEIRLTPGTFSASLEWRSPADLNLFVRDPINRTINWSSPTSPSGGALQIDSNNGCTTPSAEPVEHIFWNGTPPPGDYRIWAWYQGECLQSAPVTFTLTIRVNGDPLIVNESVLNPRERFDMTIRISSTGEGFIVNPGTITLPSPQQTSSEGGDTVIVYGDSREDALTNEVYARFYQFSGTAGEQIRIIVEPVEGDLDPLVVLRNAADQNMPNGVNDDADVTTRAARLDYTLTYTGQYIIAVSRFGVRDGTTTGRYRLTLERVAP